MPKLIIGHVTHDTARIWIRGAQNENTATVVLYFEGQEVKSIGPVALSAADANTAIVDFSHLDPNKYYECRVYFYTPKGVVSVTENSGFRTFPEDAETFTFMFSSCNLYRPEAGDLSEQVFTSLKSIAAQTDVRFMIHSGDQIYIDIGEPDESVVDVNSYRKRYLEAWSGPQASGLLKNIPNYMILDDHELANEFDNDLDSKKQMYHRPIGAYRVDGLKAYNEFQHSHNPTTDDGVYYFNFDYAGIPFFVMDVRADRMRSTGKMIDKAQMSAFTAWLRKNSDKLKMVVSAVPFITRVINFAMNPKDKWPSDIFIGQRNEILKYIAEGDIHKTIFLTGDIHSAALASLKLERAGLPDIELNEIVAGPMSQKITNGKVTVLRKEHNSLLTASTNMRYNCTVYSRLQYWPRLVKKKDANVCVVKVNIPDASVTFNWWRIHDFPGLGPKLVTDDIKIPQG